MTDKKKYERPLHLDMDFGEALRRFSLTPKKEIDDVIVQSKCRQGGRGHSMPLRWSKKLSRTDAQQKTGGYPVPYLRFTRAGHSQDNQTWFRNTFFAGANWNNGYFGEHAVEIANVNFHVTILGANRGVRQMMVTHDDDRMLNNNTPNTYLHYDDATRAELQTQDLTGRLVAIEKDAAGTYRFTIT